MTISETEVQLVNSYSKNIDMQDIGLFWQLTIKTIDDLKIVGNENLTLEMYIMQLAHLKNIDNNKKIFQETSNESNIDLTGSKIKDENLENDLSTKIKNQLKNINQIKSSPMKNISSQSSKTEITNFQDLINIANKEKEVELKYDLERNVKLVSFNKGKIDISFNEDLNKNFIKNLTEKLLLWTGDRWIISLSKNIEAKSVYEKNIEKKSSKLVEFKKSELAKQMEEAFPDAKLEDIQEKNND
jgi:DNA polymerase-3 subunit gamma/tau